MGSSEFVLEVEGVQKAYGHVQALKDAHIRVRAGEIVALVGDNGAGKSTLVNVMSGVIKPDGGRVTFAGEDVEFHNAAAAREAGIETIHQKLGLCDNLSIVQNLFLGRELTHRGTPFFRKREMRKKAREILERLGVSVASVDQPVFALSGGQRQMVSIGRVLLGEAKVVLLDEPTAALSVRATSEVLDLMRRLRDLGVGVVIISHSLPDVFSVCDRVTVLRQGRTSADLAISETDPDSVVGLMTGALEGVPSSAGTVVVEGEK